MSTPPIPDAIQKLRDGKQELRRARIAMSLPDKVREVVQLQRIMLPLIRRRRELREWERVWPVDEDSSPAADGGVRSVGPAFYAGYRQRRSALSPRSGAG
jgi:hypothetical protein